MTQRPLFTVLSVLALLLCASGAMQANAITGALPFVAFNVTEDGADLSASTMLTAAASNSSGLGLGDFSIIPDKTPYGTFTFDVASIATGAGFSISNPLYGSFIASSGVIQTQRSDFLSADLFGVYMPGAGFPGFSSESMEVDLAFTQTGGTVSSSGTLAAPPPASSTPEPGTMTLFGSAVLVIAAGLRRRFRM